MTGVVAIVVSCLRPQELKFIYNLDSRLLHKKTCGKTGKKYSHIRQIPFRSFSHLNPPGMTGMPAETQMR